MQIDPLEGKALTAVQVPNGCRIVAFDGAVRSSKTVSSLLLWVEYVMHGPSGLLLIAGKTETAVINNLVLPLQDILGRKRVSLNRGTGMVTILGRECRIIGANDEQARTKIQGMTLAGAYLDEAANIPQSFFNMLWSRLSVPGAMLFLTCNPEGPKHWLLTEWLLRATVWIDQFGARHERPVGTNVRIVDRDLPVLPLYRVTFVLDDNHHLARTNPEYVATLKASWPVKSMWYRRYILSEWASSDGAVYDVWDEPNMTLDSRDLPAIDRLLFVGMDFGSVHQTRAYALGMCRVNLDADGDPDWADTKARGVDTARYRTVLIVLDEFAPTGGTVGAQAQQFDAWYQRQAEAYGDAEWVAVDSAARVMLDELRARGFANVMGAHKAVLPGIQTVASLMGGGRLYVVRDRCPRLVSGIPSYLWDAKAKDAGRTEVVKENDDEVDALRYAVYTSRTYWQADIPLAPIQVDAEDEVDDSRLLV